MTYQETLEWMFNRLPMYQRKGAAAYNAKLEPSIAFAEYLGNPHLGFKSIHVAGTNGKGSSSHMLASVLQEAGYKTGLYTSPHLKDFRERIRVDGSPVPESYVVEFIDRHKPYLEEHALSFFELTVGMALAWFRQAEVDIAVIEVGLGGRLDSTNIIMPEVSLITNIGMDHMEFLGETLPEIAREKAGIIKEGIPVVISETQEQVAPVFHEVAAARKAPIVFADQLGLPDHPTSLLGHYQKRNVRGVIATLRTLKDFEIRDSHIRKGLMQVVENTGLLGRWQVLSQQPKVICDTAHNREGLELVLQQLEEESRDNLHMVLGFVKEKRLDQILPLFPENARYYFARPDIPRGLDAEALQQAAFKYGLKGAAYPSVSDALAAARKTSNPGDLIYVGGSTFTVAEVL